MRGGCCRVLIGPALARSVSPREARIPPPSQTGPDMTESELLLHATVAVLLLCLGCHHSGWARRLGRPAFSLMICGALLPLLDLLLFYLRASDRVALFSEPPFFSALFYGLLSLAGLAALTAFLAGLAVAARVFLLLLAGYLLNQVLALFTPAGAALLAPFNPVRQSLPLFYSGHALLLGVLVLALILLEALPRHRRAAGWTAVGLLLAYVLAGVGQYTYMVHAARHLGSEAAEISVEPASPWLTRWLVTVVEGNTYQVRRHGLDEGHFEEPEILERWNDEVMMAHLLGDPTVSLFFRRVFRHPVARLESTDLRVTLIMREAGDFAPPVPGRTFLYEADHEGRNRFYQVQRFH